MDIPTQHQTSTITAALLARVTKGDQQAFSQLYDHSSTLLFTLAVRILWSHDDAAELLQQIYLDIWRKVTRYDIGRGAPISWLVSITHSRAIERLRTRAAQGQQIPTGPNGQALAKQLGDHGPSPYETRIEQERRLAISATVAELPHAQLQAIELAYYEGLTHIEIAERLHQSLETVNAEINRAMAQLRERLQPYLHQGDTHDT